MKLLDAVNLVMPKLGERPVSSLTVKHPTLSVMLPIIDNQLGDFCNRGWWFNKYDYTAFPDPDGNITLGDDTLSFIPGIGYEGVLRGKRLFRPSDMSYVYPGPVKGIVTQLVEFELLPESAASYVFNSSLVEAFVTDIGMSQELGIWQQAAGASWNLVLSEHLRQMKINTRMRRPFRQLTRAMNI